VLSSVAVTVIVAVPSATAVTLPLSSTVATASSLLFHVTVFIYALLGETVNVNVCSSSGANDNVSSVIATEVTATFSTFIKHVALTAQLEAVIAISSHTATGVTNHVLDTVALLVLPLVQLIGNSLEVGVTVAVNCNVSKGEASLTVHVVGLTKIASGCIGLSCQDCASISSS
jgi:hypothetical protein